MPAARSGSSAGNALDVANLGVALMRRLGNPGAVRPGDAVAEPGAAVDPVDVPGVVSDGRHIPAGTQTSDPTNDAQLLSETESHYWFKFDTGSGMQDADPLMAGATIGQTFAASTGTFTEVPDALRETTKVSLTAEIYSAAARGSAPRSRPRLSWTRPSTTSIWSAIRSLWATLSQSRRLPSAIFGFTDYTYTPYIDIGDEADPWHDTLIQGTPYQEVLTDFPLASQILTGLFLNVTQSGPIGPSGTYQSTILDRIGYAARQSGSPVSVSVAPTSLSAVQTATIQTINMLSGLQSPAVEQPLLDHLRDEQSLLSTSSAVSVISSTSVAALRSTVITAQQVELVQYARLLAQEEVANLEVGDVSTAYFDRPSITIAGSNFDTTGSSVVHSFNLLNNAMSVIPAPRQNTQAALVFNMTRGLLDNTYEGEVVPVPEGVTSLGTFSILQQAVSQSVPLTTISSDNLEPLAALDLPADVEARITTAVEQGELVWTPVRPVMIGTTAAITWLEINPTTGEVSGLLPDGTRSLEDEAVIDGNQTFKIQASVKATEVTSELAEAEAELEAISAIPNTLEQIAAKKNVANLLRSAIALAESAGATNDLSGELAAPLIIVVLLGPLEAAIAANDPPLPDLLLGLNFPFPNTPTNPATASDTVAVTLPTGALAANVTAPSVAVSGDLSASWSSTSVSNFQATTLRQATPWSRTPAAT